VGFDGGEDGEEVGVGEAFAGEAETDGADGGLGFEGGHLTGGGADGLVVAGLAAGNGS